MRIESVLAMLLILLGGCSACAQGHQWWADNVGWDGARPFQDYLRLNPAGMGPHALPVPRMHRMAWDTTSWFAGEGLYHHHRQEHTVASRLSLQWAASEWFRLLIQVVPLEYFDTEHDLKTDRRIFWQDYDRRTAGGDFHVESLIRLPPRWFGGLQSELRVGLRAPSGTHLGAARFTDTPGYYFDMAVSRHLGPVHSLELMAGFLVYQTYDHRHKQNDCLLWGVSHRWQKGRWGLMQSLRGFSGYFGDGDKPVIYEAELAWQPADRWSWRGLAGVGLHDYPFRFLGAGVHWHFHLPVQKG